jgi:hypothetical protein
VYGILLLRIESSFGRFFLFAVLSLMLPKLLFRRFPSLWVLWIIMHKVAHWLFSLFEFIYQISVFFVHAPERVLIMRH